MHFMRKSCSLCVYMLLSYYFRCPLESVEGHLVIQSNMFHVAFDKWLRWPNQVDICSSYFFKPTRSANSLRGLTKPLLQIENQWSALKVPPR